MHGMQAHAATQAPMARMAPTALLGFAARLATTAFLGVMESPVRRAHRVERARQVLQARRASPALQACQATKVYQARRAGQANLGVTATRGKWVRWAISVYPDLRSLGRRACRAIVECKVRLATTARTARMVHVAKKARTDRSGSLAPMESRARTARTASQEWQAPPERMGAMGTKLLMVNLANPVRRDRTARAENLVQTGCLANPAPTAVLAR